MSEEHLQPNLAVQQISNGRRVEMGVGRRPVVRFFMEPVHQPFRSTQEGRQIYEDQEFVEIMFPGDLRSKVVERVSDQHKIDYPEAYAAFRAGEEAPVLGTPLKEWPTMTASRVRELAHFNIVTVEQLAEVPDGPFLDNLGMGARDLREKAKTFLEVARDGTGPLERLMERALRAERGEADYKRRYEDEVAARQAAERELDRIRGAPHASA